MKTKINLGKTSRMKHLKKTHIRFMVNALQSQQSHLEMENIMHNVSFA